MFIFVGVQALTIKSIEGGEYMNLVYAASRWISDEDHFKWMVAAFNKIEVYALPQPESYYAQEWESDTEEEDSVSSYQQTTSLSTHKAAVEVKVLPP